MTDLDALHRRIEDIDGNTDAVEIITLVAEMMAEVAVFANKLERRIAELEDHMAKVSVDWRQRNIQIAADPELCEHGNWPDECEQCR